MNKLEQIPQFMLPYCNGKLRVGFSGGADSSALLLLLLEWGWLPDQLEAVHFDHGLRGKESCDDAQWCKDFCARLKVPFTLVELHLHECADNSGSIEDLARQKRLHWYQSHADNTPAVLAHHSGDVVENLLLKLARGGNVSSLCSLQKERKLGNVLFLRPLLEMEKTELEAYLRSKDISDWRHDSSNDSSEYHRNYLRNEVLKKWQDYHAPVKSGLRRACGVLALDAEFIEQCALEKLQALGDPLPETTPCSFWRTLHPALLARVLVEYLNCIGGISDVKLSRTMLDHFQQVLDLPVSAEKRFIELGQKCCFVLKNDLLSWNGAAGAIPEKQLWQWQDKPEIRWGCYCLKAELLPGAVDDRADGVFCFDADPMPEELFLSARAGGEKMSVWGSSGLRRVKHLLSGCNAPEDVVLISDKQGNIYLLGEFRRSSFAPVSGDTRNTLRITVAKLPVFCGNQLQYDRS